VKSSLRKLLHAVLRQLLRLRSHPLASSSGGSTLIIAPHADDETLGCGGLIRRRLGEGASISVLYITDGSASHPGHTSVSPTGLAARRKSEARAALALLGVASDRLHFLAVRDGTLAQLDATAAADLVDHIGAEIARLQPGEIFLPCRADGSSEHDATFAFVHAALVKQALTPRVLEYPVWSWWSPRLLVRHVFRRGSIWRHELGDDVDLKRRALASYTSQTEPVFAGEPACLPAGFLAFFLGPTEYFFEPGLERR
jgi:LmbE family N-acetylglucosaminyl deacetylase